MKNIISKTLYIGSNSSVMPSAISAERVISKASLTPTSEIKGLAVVKIAYKFIQGGIILFMHCGIIMDQSVFNLENANDSAASHCPRGID